MGIAVVVLGIAILGWGACASAYALPQPSPIYNGDLVLRTTVLMWSDSRDHYVQLREDTAGVVRVLIDLEDAPIGTYAVATYGAGACPVAADAAPFEDRTLRWTGEASAGGPFVAFDTDKLALSRNAADTIYDADGTTMTVKLPSGELLGCAVISSVDAELYFDNRVALEFAVAFEGADGHEHYVTLRQDDHGVVQIQLQLTDVLAGTYTVATYSDGGCSNVTQLDISRAIEKRQIIRPSPESGDVVKSFYTTNAISLARNVPKSVYDADGTSLAVYNNDGSLLGCADISAVDAQPLPTVTPEPPGAGTGIVGAQPNKGGEMWLPVAWMLAGLGVLALLILKRR